MIVRFRLSGRVRIFDTLARPRVLESVYRFFCLAKPRATIYILGLCEHMAN